MDARFERYIENLRTVRTLSQPKFSPDMKAKELLETIQSNAIKCFDYMKENNAILNELVFQRAPAELTSAEIASLQEFADKMFNYASSEDCGIAYKVYSLLLENARLRGDKPAIVRYLYGKAVSLHYLNVRGRDYAINPYGAQVRCIPSLLRHADHNSLLRVRAILRSMSPSIRQQKATSCAVWATAGCPCHAVRRKNAPNI